MVVSIIVVTTLTALIVSLFLPKKYIASASVLVDAKPDPISSLIYPGMSSPAFMNTQADVLNSDKVALKVIKDLNLAQVPALREQWSKQALNGIPIDQWLIPVVKGGVDIIPSRESNVLTVTYKAPDPKYAALMANAYVQAYLRVSLELRVEPAKQYTGYFNEQAKAALERLESAKKRLSDYQRENGIVDSDEKLDVETQRLNELSSQLVAIQSLTADSGSRQAQAGQAADRLPEVLNNGLIAQLKADLGRAEANLQDLTTRYGESHPQVQQARASIKELRARLDAETRRVTGGVTVANSINRQREADIRASLDQQRAKVLKLKVARDQASVLSQEVEAAQRAFDAISTRLAQTSLESQSNQSNISVLAEAVPPPLPASPRVGLNTALALVVGIILAAGIALIMELQDQKVRSTDDVLAVLPAPLLGVLSSAGKATDNLAIAAPKRLLGRSNAPQKGAA